MVKCRSSLNGLSCEANCGGLVYGGRCTASLGFIRRVWLTLTVLLGPGGGCRVCRRESPGGRCNRYDAFFTFS